MSKAEEAAKIARWSPAWLASYIDRGWIDTWPFEITRKGRRELARRKQEALIEREVRARMRKGRRR